MPALVEVPDSATPPEIVPVPAPDPEPEPAPVTEVACGPFDDAARERVLGLINAARAEARSCGQTAFDAAPALGWDTRLADAARDHSYDMATKNFFSHTGSDGSSAGARATAAGFAWSAIGENIAAGQRDAEAAVQGWIDSPGHCRNLMNSRFTGLGMACVSDDGSEYGSYWTQMLGRSR